MAFAENCLWRIGWRRWHQQVFRLRENSQASPSFAQDDSIELAFAPLKWFGRLLKSLQSQGTASLRAANCPTQAKRRLEWATRRALCLS